jgi:DNA-binding GntR family transcriptional regulator
MGRVRGHRLRGADVSAAEHDAIMQAIRAGDVESTSRLTSAHLSGASGRLIRGLFPEAESADAAAAESA